MDFAFPFGNLFGYPGTTTKMYLSMLVSRFLFLLIFRSEHSCLGSENWGRILSGGWLPNSPKDRLPRESTPNTELSGTSMVCHLGSNQVGEFQPHTLYVCMYVCAYVCTYMYVCIQVLHSLSGRELPFVYFASRSFLEPCRGMKQSKFIVHGV